MDLSGFGFEEIQHFYISLKRVLDNKLKAYNELIEDNTSDKVLVELFGQDIENRKGILAQVERRI